jgi:uridine kinase
MKVALLISGYLRTFKENILNIEKNIINKFDNIDIYVHITKHENEEDAYLNPSDINDNIKFINNKLNPVALLVEDNIEASKLFNTWIKFYKLNNLKCINEEIYGKYDLVIKYRPDLKVISEDIFDRKIKKDNIYIPKDSKIDKDKLSNKNDGYICDMFAYGDSETMNKYFELFVHLKTIINEYNSEIPETVLYNYLKKYNIKYNLLNIHYEVILSKCNVFAICGDSGSGKSTLSNLLKNSLKNSFILEGDRYHKWDRSNENWQNYTHLNPQANYVSKMNEDVFALKLGNEIFQVDYEHNTGKFTEKKTINPSDNLIVCGLHSLYNNNSVYDLKIYMDTDDSLKKKWKINRDVNERGYSLEKVLKTIEKRKNDYINYIIPQKENADIIVRFFTEGNTDINNLEKDNCLSLELSITNRLDIVSLLETLRNNNIDFLTFNKEGFSNIIFNKYKNCQLFDILLQQKTNTFYDYILYFILNLAS